MNWLAWSMALASSAIAGAARDGQDAAGIPAPGANTAAEETPQGPIGPGEYTEVPDDTRDDSVPLPVKPVYESTPQGDVLVRPASGDPYFLGFAGGSYYPPADEIVDPQLLAQLRSVYTDGRPASETYAFVMFSKRMTRERIDRLAAAGARVLEFHPYYCMKVALTAPEVDAIAALDFVRWIGVPRASQKVHPAMQLAAAQLRSGELIDAYVDVFESDLTASSTAIPFGSLEVGGPNGVEALPAPAPTQAQSLTGNVRTNGWQERQLEQLGLVVRSYEEAPRAFRVRLHPSQIATLTALDYVQFVEPKFEPTLAHDESMPLVNMDRTRATYDGNFSGAAVAGQADSGLDYSHSGLNGFYWWSSNLTGSSEGSTTDNCEHGSHVAGTIQGNTTVDASYEGAANGLAQLPTTRYFNTKIFYGSGCWWGGATMSQIVGAFNHAITDSSSNVTPRPQVINHSWGSTGAPFYGTEADCRTLDADIYANHQLHVFAAGNEGPSGQSVRMEASAKNVLTVGSVNDFETLAGDPGTISSFSSRGPTADLRWKPNLCAPGDAIYSVDANSGTGYVNKSGTSMAAPHVTGLAAELCDHTSFFRWNPTSLSAVLMATALTKNDQLLTSPSSASTDHLNMYGTGRIEAYTAHYTGSQLAQYYYGWDQGTSGYNFVDVPIQAGATRIVVCMNYHEGAASSGASKALVNDLDMYIDAPPFTAGGNTGDYTAQQSGVNNTEIRSLNSPAAGTWRIKVYSESCTGTTHVGLAVSIVYGDTTPPISLSMTQSDTYIRPNDDFTVTATVSNNDYIASGVFLDTTTSGDVLQSSSTTLYGGAHTDLMHNPAGGRDVVLGDIRYASSRTATWTTRWASEGVKIFGIDARADNSTGDTTSTHVYVDGTAPIGPTNLVSTSHVPNVNDCSNVVNMTWSPATDAISGLDGYVGLFDTSPGTIPSGNTNIAASATTFSDTIQVGVYFYYFHLRAKDRSGNYGTTVHAGPYSAAGPPSVYCTAKLNSLACLPAIAFSGTPSESSPSPFLITASNLINKKSGLLFYSTTSGNILPFQGGWLCMGTPIVRTNVQNSGGSQTGSDCTGTYTYDFNAKIQSGSDANLVAGHKVRAQYWSRDPSDPFTTSLTNAVVFYICD